VPPDERFGGQASLMCIPAKKRKPKSNHEETSAKPKSNEIPQNNWAVFKI
jgi:hypothetical protein